MSGSNMKCQATQQFVSQDYFIDFSGVIILHLILTHSECSVVFWYQNLNDGWLARGLRIAFPWVVSMDVQWMFLETYQQTGIHIFLPCARWHHSESQFCCISDPNVHSWSIFLSKFRPLAIWIHIHGIPFWIEKTQTRPFHPQPGLGQALSNVRQLSMAQLLWLPAQRRWEWAWVKTLGIFQRNAVNVHHKQYFDMNYRLTVGYQGFMIHSHVG